MHFIKNCSCSHHELDLEGNSSLVLNKNQVKPNISCVSGVCYACSSSSLLNILAQLLDGCQLSIWFSHISRTFNPKHRREYIMANISRIVVRIMDHTCMASIRVAWWTYQLLSCRIQTSARQNSQCQEFVRLSQDENKGDHPHTNGSSTWIHTDFLPLFATSPSLVQGWSA